MKNWQRNLFMGGGAAAWAPPANCVLWLSAVKSGAVVANGTWVDQSGSGNNLSLANGAYVDATSGFYGDGSNNVGMTSTSFSFWQAKNAWTVCCWVQPTARHNDYAIVVGANAPPYPGLLSRGKNVSPANTIYANHSTVVNDGTPTIDAWVFHAAIYNGSTLTLYTNASSSSVGDSGNGCAAAQVITVGALGVSGKWLGWIDEILVFSRALTGPEIAGIYANPYTKV